MTKHFHKELERLKKKMLRLVAMVEESLNLAVRSISNHDLELAEQVVLSDEKVDAVEVEVEEECLKILALHQPVAADLRYVVAVMKITNDLERIADLAANIAKRTRILSAYPSVNIPYDLADMLKITVRMVRMSVDSLVSSDVATARQVCLLDDEVDGRHKFTFTAVQEGIKANPGDTECLIAYLSVSKNLERIADHATNIAEDVIYMIEGEIVRHQSV